MIPYADFLYFGVTLYVILPTLAVRSFLGFSRVWILVASVAMLAPQCAGTVTIGPGSEVPELVLLAAYALFQWLVAAAFLWARPRTTPPWAFPLALVLALLPLLAAKALPLLAPGSLFGFLGLSYVTFRSLDVIFAIQDRLIPSLPPAQYLAFLFFFPTASSGPIDRWRRFADDWKRLHTREDFLVDLDRAVHRIFTGFFYKFIVAALINCYWLVPLAGGAGLGNNLLYMYVYSFYLFFDFAGYSSFAIGFSCLLGIHTPENFDRPFLARNIRDFWNRWHISLSWWFRDHVYMRFLMAATQGRWFKNKHTASYIGYYLSFGLMAVWHGIAWHYLIYGLYHATLMAAYDWFSRWNRQRKLWGEGPFWTAASVLVTFHLVCFGLLLFSGHLGQASLSTLDAQSVTPSPAAATEIVESLDGREGNHDVTDCDAIRGWAWDNTRPNTPIEVDIYDGSTLLAKVVADQLRDDLIEMGKGNGKHGFTYATPPLLKDGRPHSIRARIGGTNIDLRGTPKVIHCPRQ